MRTVDGSRSLVETAEGGLEATGAAAPVTAVLDIIEGLKGQDQVRCPPGRPRRLFRATRQCSSDKDGEWKRVVNLHLQSGGL